MVAEGLRQLQARGVRLGVEHLTLEEAYVALDIPRSSSHSAWAIDEQYLPQETYQRAVLKAWLVERESSLFADAAADALTELFARNESPSMAAIVRTAVQAAFIAGNGLGEDGDGVGDYNSTDLALRFAIVSPAEDERDGEILGWLRAGELTNRANRIADSYKPLAELLSLRPRPEYGEAAYMYLAIAVASLVEGIGLRNRILPEFGLDQPLFDTPEGDPPALLIGVCVESMVDCFFEPISVAE